MQQRNNWDFSELPTDEEREQMMLEARGKDRAHQAEMLNRRLNPEGWLERLNAALANNSKPT